jgi:hypothetical protein
MYARMAGAPYVLRAGVAPDRTAAAARVLVQHAPAEHILLDFGSGRILAGLPSLTDDAWKRFCQHAAEQGGHVVLDQAPEEFKKGHDVFGFPRPEWKLMHRIKDVLDPKHLFAPGRLPGGV